MGDYDFTFAHEKEGFDTHIDNSIRGYKSLIDDTINLSQYYVNDGSKVYDIGCSTGKMLERMVIQNHSFAPDAHYFGVELSPAFSNEMRETEQRVSDLTKNFKLILGDARSIDMANASLVTSIFTLQFMPMNEREALVKEIYKCLKPGGAFIFAEKIIHSDARLHQMMTFMYYDYKRTHFTGDEILDKEKTLRHMLKPHKRSELIAMIRHCGFSNIESFWQNHQFVGFISIKD